MNGVSYKQTLLQQQQQQQQQQEVSVVGLL
jgi:hypothetical protein